MKPKASPLPNMARLTVERAAQLMIDRAKPGTRLLPNEFGLMASVIALIGNTGKFVETLKEAQAWAKESVRVVRASKGGEVFRTDEEAAGAILKALDEKKQKKTP